MDSYLDFILTTRKTSFREHMDLLTREGGNDSPTIRQLLATKQITMTSHPVVICNDGATVSVQVGEHMYCTPRDNTGPWTEVEAGFPSHQPPESWRQYAEEPERPLSEKLSTLWFWVKYFAKEIIQNRQKLRIERLMNTSLDQSRGLPLSYKYMWRTIKEYGKDIFRSYTLRDTVFPYIPLDVLMEYFEEHGGVNDEACWVNYATVIAKGGYW